ncbi:MAG TPA: penicillin-binding transpeptidase domain-containing protein [Chlamydiales bacterium]|nr:penicillin-binding transpeptidase domain-containing protein [Chlamydiales bacterium]
MIFFKVFHLTTVLHDEKIVESQRPQKKSTIEYGMRGPILDRFNQPIATNLLQFNACIYYADIKNVRQSQLIQQDKKKIRIYPRRQHIKDLSKLLGKELDMDPERIEDLIHSKAALFPNTPFPIKTNISEKTYYRLKMLERTWAGLSATANTIRHYPFSYTASDVIGYMGAISSEEYLKLSQQIKDLNNFLEKVEANEIPSFPEGISSIHQAIARLKELEAKAYSMNDLMGKTGIESYYEKILRASHGKSVFLINNQGSFLKKLNTSFPAQEGDTICSSLSIELQEFAEKLLAEEENLSKITDAPTLRGGAIVIMDPNTGEVLTLASYPSHNLNDFSTKNFDNLNNWFETKQHIEDLYFAKKPFIKRTCNKRSWKDEKTYFNWKGMLKNIAPEKSEFFTSLNQIKSLVDAAAVQESIDLILYHAKTDDAEAVIDLLFPKKEGHIVCKKRLTESKKKQILSHLENKNAVIEKEKKKILQYAGNLKDNKDKLFFIDFLKTIINSYLFSNDLLNKMDSVSLEDYFSMHQKLETFSSDLQKDTKDFYQKTYFTKWKKEFGKEFLEYKRQIEKENNLYAKPYIDYYDKELQKQFSSYWKKNRTLFLLMMLLSEEELLSFTNKKLDNEILLIRNLKKEYLNNSQNEQITSLKTQLPKLSPTDMYQFLKTFRTPKEMQRPLLRKYPFLKNHHKKQTEQDLLLSFYPKYGYGFARSHAFREATPLGSIFKIVTGYAALKQKYLSLKNAGLPIHDLNPFTMEDKIVLDNQGKTIVGYSLKGAPYYRNYKGGRLPRSSHSMMGIIDFQKAFEQSSNPYFSILAGDYLHHPQNLLDAAKDFGFGETTGIDLPYEIKGSLPKDLEKNKTNLYSFAIGQHSLIVTPLQVASMLSTVANGGTVYYPTITKQPPRIKRTIFMPKEIQKTLLDSMERVIYGSKGSARSSIIPKLLNSTKLRKNYLDLKGEFFGKTSTAEIMVRPYLLPSTSAKKMKHVWFGALSFKDKKPELAIAVYLKYQSAGKQAAPIASELIHKYRELQEKHLLQQKQKTKQDSDERAY